MNWIYGLVVGVFTLSGIFIVILGFAGHTTSDPSGWIDPQLEMKLLGVFFIVSPWIGILILEMKFKRDRSFTQSILDQGVLRRAVLKDYRETGTYVNDAPKLKMRFEVTEEDGTVRPVEVTGVVDLLHVVQLKRDLEVTIHESDRGVVIHWDHEDGDA